MPNINDRIGSQNVIRVLSNASAPPTRLVNLTDVDSTRKTEDGMILVWDLSTETFFMTDIIDSAGLTVTGIVTFSNTTGSTSTTSGALVVNGGVGIAKEVYIGNTLSVSGISTFGSDLDINAAVDILNGLKVGGNFESIGITTLASSGGITTTGGDLNVAGNANIIGIATFTNDIDANGSLDVDGHTELDNVNASGISSAAAFANFNYLQAPFGSTVSFTVTVGSKDSTHRYQGQGSGNAYLINDVQAPFLTLTPGRTYRFVHDNTGSHPLKFYLEADKTTEYTSGVSFQDTYTEITISDETPTVLHYQCTAHGYMGNAIQTNSNVVNTNYDAILRGGLDVDGHTELDNLNVSGVSTFTGAIDANGSLDVDGHTELDDVNVSGLSTFTGLIDANGGLDVNGHSELDNLNVSGVSTFVGVGTFSNDLYVGGDLYVADDLVFDEFTARNGNITGVATVGTLLDVNGNLDVDGHTELDNLRVSGISTFVGNASFANNVSIAGTLTYEDVTNVDAIGLITARSGLEAGFPGAASTLTAGGDLTLSRDLHVAGLSTFVGIATFSNDAFVAGTLTAGLIDGGLF